MNILAIVPAYNEEENIRAVISELSAKDIDIVVINDCSLDNTRIQAEKDKKAVVLDLPVNLGIGGAVQTGFKYAVENHYDYTFQFDGDGQHVGEEIDKLLSILQKNEANVVIGSRFIDSKKTGFQSTKMRRIGIRFLSFVIFCLTRRYFFDPTSGFRAYDKRTTAFLAQHYPMDYPEPEAIVLLCKNKFRIAETQVVMRERQNGVSSINGLKTIYYMIKVSLACIISAMRPAIKTKE